MYIIVVFQRSLTPWYIDGISLEFKELTGRLPRFNLITHSRGGMTAIKYATYHVYNVVNMISMGSPYSGSALGSLELTLKFMGYTDTDYNILTPGVASIVDENDSKFVRDEWNKNYKLDADLKVIALGSISSFSQIKSMIYEVENDENSEYYKKIEDYILLINILLNLVEDNPSIVNDAAINVNFATGVLNAFGIDTFAALAPLINKNLKGKITYEEVREVLKLVQNVNGELTILDDIFIDTNSQLGYGFSDGKSYNGFNRYVKVFTPNDITANRCYPNLPGIVHNLEIMNDDFTDLIINTLTYGCYEGEIEELTDSTNNSYYFDNAKSFIFNIQYRGIRKISASSCNIKVYSYNSNGCLELKTSSNDSVSFMFLTNTKYLIIIERTTSCNNNVKVDFLNKMSIGNNYVSMYSKEQLKYYISCTKSGYYIIETNSSVTISGASYISSGKYYIYLEANENKTIYLYNNSSSVINFYANVYEPNTHSVDTKTNVTYINKVTKFTNTTGYTMTYKIYMSWTSGTKSANIVNSNNVNIATCSSASKQKTYSFTLDANETCYIIYSSIGFSTKLSINAIKMAWEIDGVLYTEKEIILPKNNRYYISLVTLNDNGSIRDYIDKPVHYISSQYYDLSDNWLEIYDTAPIGGEIQLAPDFALDYMVKIIFGYDDCFYWNISNKDSVTINFSSLDVFDKIGLTIYSDDCVYDVTAKSEVFDISSYLSTEEANIVTIELNYVEYCNRRFENGIPGLNVNDTYVNSLFDSGCGTSSSPYLISCYRHLDNIRKDYRACYKITSDIDLSGYTWTPIQMFYGEIEGNYNNIRNMKITISKAGDCYGFIKNLYGKIKNLKFVDATINTFNVTASNSYSYVGIIAGYCGSAGYIYNCDVKGNSTIDVRIYKSYIGGLVGNNCGKIELSYYMGSDMHVSGKYSGGIVGKNSGQLIRCNHSSCGDITYHYVDGNSYIGGIVGENTSSGSLKNCYSYGTIYWTSPKKGKEISPYLGKLIGKNSGTYSNCGSGMGYSYSYYYWHFIGYYDQSSNCFKIDNELVGNQ